MSKSVLTQTIFAGSLENEQILNRWVEENNRDPKTIAFRKEQAIQEAIYNARVLDTDSIKLWIAALRSGQYKQKVWTYTNKFRDKTTILKYRVGDYHFSALGVLCEVTKDLTGGEWHGEWFVKKGLSFEDWTKDGNSNIHVPHWALEKLGIKTIESDLIQNINQLSNMNVYMDFKQIADIIESEYLN